MAAAHLSRGQLLARGTVLLAGSALGALVPPAAAAPSDADLAHARLLVAVELLGLDFYRRAIGSRRFTGDALQELRRARLDERRHYDAAAAILVAAGQVPATAADIDFSYPRGSFSSRGSIARLGARLESMALGAHLGAVDGFETSAFKQRAARSAANEAQHLSIFTAEAGGRRIGPAFPRSLSIDRVSGLLERFTS